MEYSDSCNTCVEKFNQSTRKRINCASCEYVQCLDCVKKILLDSKSLEFSCINCKKEWDLPFLRSVLPFTFVNTKLKQHMKNILFAREYALMPATQPYVEAEIKKKELTEKKSTYNNRLHFLKSKMVQVNNALSVVNLSLDKKINLVKLKANLEKDISYYESERKAATEIIKILSEHNFSETKVNYQGVCPKADCKGYLSTQYKCGLCNVEACSECCQIKLENHVCKSEDIESIKIIQKESRPCPRCRSLIMKVANTCDQVFCTMCHLAFSWKTGKIDTGYIHNPEYHQIMRSKFGGVAPRNLNDIPCGGLPNSSQILNHVDDVFFVKNVLNFDDISSYDDGVKFATNLSYIHRLHENIRTSLIPKCLVNLDDNRDIRIKYMLNEISKEKFEQLIVKRELVLEKRKEIAQILSTYQNATVDIVQSLMSKNTIAEIKLEMDRLNSLKNYINDCFAALQLKYKCSMPYISFDYLFIGANSL